MTNARSFALALAGRSPVGICDIGAVEVQPTDLAWPLFLPALQR